MNMAAIWKLPVIYVCENNLYCEYTHFTETTSGELLGRARAFGIHAREIDGQDIRTVYGTALQLVERTRQGLGPAFLLSHTYRYHGHHVGDISRGYYRSKEEETEWRTERDPLQLLAEWLVAEGAADAQIIQQIETDARSEAESALEFALNAPFPDVSEVDEHVYA